jgi:hypothetical protein
LRAQGCCTGAAAGTRLRYGSGEATRGSGGGQTQVVQPAWAAQRASQGPGTPPAPVSVAPRGVPCMHHLLIQGATGVEELMSREQAAVGRRRPGVTDWAVRTSTRELSAGGGRVGLPRRSHPPSRTSTTAAKVTRFARCAGGVGRGGALGGGARRVCGQSAAAVRRQRGGHGGAAASGLGGPVPQRHRGAPLAGGGYTAPSQRNGIK